MSLPRYSQYKDSGVPWLGAVPAHWDVCALKRVASLRSGEGITAEQIEETGQYPVYGGNGQRGFTSSFTHEGRFALIGRQGALCGNINYSVGKFWASEHAVVATPIKPVETTWLGEMLRAMNLNQYSVSAAQPGLSVELISNIGVPYPPIEEQAAIATLLDRETGKIDALIAEQEKLLTLLAEKRQATISHAVTKGLNPDVPMKDSGVEWLGKVPAHWKTTRLKYAASLIVDCPHETPVYSDDGAYKVIRTADISLGLLDSSNTYHVDEAEYINRIRRQALYKGDIVYGREGERWGFAALVPDDNIFCLGQRMMQFRAASTTCSSYLMWQLNSVSTYRQGQMDTVGATSPHVNVGTIRNYQLAEPPFEEQLSISNFLDRETAKLDALTAEANRTIELLKERRSALISAAVTGQIDVRGMVATPSFTHNAEPC